MKCKDLMKRDVECLLLAHTAQVAAQRMRLMNVGFLPVCDDSMQVLGTITDRDLALRLVALDLPASSTTVDELLTPGAVACHPEDDIEEAARLMAERRVSRILIVDDEGTLVGVISLSDIARIENGAAAAETLRQVVDREVRVH
ncbi:MAG TPA: CBS domain-containing protein [Myxococcaceae bacterium]|nr:CBS domain-containing protein [Myxococcaceae bacterium]